MAWTGDSQSALMAWGLRWPTGVGAIRTNGTERGHPIQAHTRAVHSGEGGRTDGQRHALRRRGRPRTRKHASTRVTPEPPLSGPRPAPCRAAPNPAPARLCDLRLLVPALLLALRLPTTCPSILVLTETAAFRFPTLQRPQRCASKLVTRDGALQEERPATEGGGLACMPQHVGITED